MFCSVRRHERSSTTDDGFTIVELVVALTVLAVGIVSVMGVTNSSIGVAGGASARSKAVAVATKEVEALRAIPYPELTDGYVTETRTTGGFRHTIERTVWQPTEPSADKHKRALVLVRWSDSAGTHEVHQQTFLYPGGIGPASNQSTVSQVADCVPAVVSDFDADQVLDDTQIATAIDLKWTATLSTCPVASYIIEFVTNGSSITREVTQLATTLGYRVTGLTPNTQYSFRVRSRSFSGQLSAWTTYSSASTGVWTTNTCQVGTITLTPSAVKKRSNGQGAGLAEAVLVTVPTQGNCSGTTFRATYRPTEATTATVNLTADAQGIHSGYLDKDLRWDVGRRYVDITDTTTNSAAGSVLLTVCEHNVAVCS
ncbi:MAG TPA: fibronectin type III domain-containing protein [Acidimicrobiales bacterium]|nr:fibronectin type III domain-containing protein [Acidimicrobiales bacterium]